MISNRKTKGLAPVPAKANASPPPLLRAVPVLLLIVWAAFFATACAAGRTDVAILWTDRPDFAFYVKYFNASQTRYKVEVFHHDFPARNLALAGNSRDTPDIVVASWLHGASTRAFLRSLDVYVGGDSGIEYAFYPGLLARGNIDGRQYLLPVSFNAPLAVFANAHSQKLSCPRTIGLEEMRYLAGGFNARAGAAFTRMGFAPTWDDGFLFTMATLFGASFRESDSAGAVEWDAAAIEQAVGFAREWIADTNAGVQATDNFTFRFFNIPPANMVLTERIMFANMDSSVFFTLAETQRNDLDFRWIAERDAIPLAEDAAYLGLARRGNAPRAADAFVRWFFSPETQQSLLERSHKFRQMETSFGIAGGFSALRPVTEQIFPRFYPGLLGRIPPEDFFSPANVLPGDWAAMKERVILPYLHERALQPDNAETAPLENRLADWARMQRF